jgi:hypothetical protein
MFDSTALLFLHAVERGRHGSCASHRAPPAPAGQRRDLDADHAANDAMAWRKALTGPRDHR